MRIRNRAVCGLFRLLWTHRFEPIHNGEKNKVIAVKGWRTCLWESPYGQRDTVTFLFRWLGE